MPFKTNVYLSKLNRKKKFDHTRTEEEYKQIRINFYNKLTEIYDLLAPLHRSQIKKRILKINLQNLKKAIKYYFTTKNGRQLANLNKKYEESARQIFKTANSTISDQNIDKIQKTIFSHLEDMITELNSQRKYFDTLEPMDQPPLTRKEIYKSLQT